ncbi:MAG: OsmC family protein [Vicinamibacterales bacterium]
MGTRAVRVSLDWVGDRRFSAESGDIRLILDSDAAAGPSPVQTLAFSLAGCIGIDLVHILTRGRHALTGVSLLLEGDRADDEPRRLIRVRLHVRVTGNVPIDAVERALRLSREKYCSVWHSMRQGIDLTTTCEVVA